MKGFEKILCSSSMYPHSTRIRTDIRYKVDKQTSNILPLIEDKDNHCIDAIRYALDGVIKQSNFLMACVFADRPEELAA